MKKLMIVVVSIFLVIGMSGCFENPTAPATVYDPTPTPEESVTPEETVEPDISPTATVYVITVTGTKAGSFTLCYKAYDDTPASPCSETRPLLVETGFVWTSMPIESDDGITLWIDNTTTDQTIVLRIFKNGVQMPGEIEIDPNLSPPYGGQSF